MQEKIQVLEVELDNCSAKEAMKRVVEHMNMERLNVVEMVTMNTLARFQEVEEDAALFKEFDLVLPSDKGILEAAGIHDERRLREVDELLFIKMIMRYLQKSRISVFLLSETEASRLQFEEYIDKEYGNLKVIGSISLEEHGSSDDMFLNLINGAEVQCVLSTLPSPMEENLISKNKALVNARVWFGFGPLIREINKEKKGWQKFKENILRRILKKEVEKHERKKNVVNNDSV